MFRKPQFDDDDDADADVDDKGEAGAQQREKRRRTFAAESPSYPPIDDERKRNQRTTRTREPPPPPPPPVATVEDADEDVAPLCSLSMYNYALELLNDDVKARSDQIRKGRIPETWEYSRIASTSELECEGDMRCRLMDESFGYLQKRGLKVSAQQRVIVKAVRAVSLSQFYGDTIQFHLPRLLGDNGWSELRSELLIFMQRRSGKTTITGALMACELVTQPLVHDISTYSNNGRASRLIGMVAYKFTRILASQEAGFGGSIKSLNKNEGMSYTTRWGTVNDCWWFPAEKKNLRGTGSRGTTGTVILEELNAMRPDEVEEIVAPTLVRKRVKLLGITTISGFDSFVIPLSEARYPDGRKVMLTLNFEMVCEDCKAKGEPEKCKCLMADLPHWHSSAQLEKLEILLANSRDTYLQEMKNLVVDSAITPAFDPRDVARLGKIESIMPMAEFTANKIFVAIDPACGGDLSKMAIVSAIFVDQLMIVSFFFVCCLVYFLCVCGRVLFYTSNVMPVRKSKRTQPTYFVSSMSKSVYLFVSKGRKRKKFCVNRVGALCVCACIRCACVRQHATSRSAGENVSATKNSA